MVVLVTAPKLTFGPDSFRLPVALPQSGASHFSRMRIPGPRSPAVLAKEPRTRRNNLRLLCSDDSGLQSIPTAFPALNEYQHLTE